MPIKYCNPITFLFYYVYIGITSLYHGLQFMDTELNKLKLLNWQIRLLWML